MGAGIAPFKYEQACVLSHDAGELFYWILWPEGYEEKYTRGSGNSTTLHIAVRWDDAAEFKFRALGGTTGTAGENMFQRQLPLKCAWAENQYLSDISKVMVGNYGGDDNGEGTTFTQDPLFDDWPSAGFIVYACTFVSLNYLVRSDAFVTTTVGAIAVGVIPELGRYIKRSQKTIPRERRMPSASFQIDGTTTRIDEVAFTPVYSTEYVLNMVEVPFDLAPIEESNERIGKVNSLTFYGRPPGTMLYKGFVGELENYVGSDGRLYLDLPHLFEYRKDGWNKIPLGFATAGGATYVYIQQAGAAPGERRPYASTTFIELFKPKSA